MLVTAHSAHSNVLTSSQEKCIQRRNFDWQRGGIQLMASTEIIFGRALILFFIIILFLFLGSEKGI